MIFVTGGAGFIGSNFICDWLSLVGESVVNLDALTYAGNLHNLDAVADDARHTFVAGNVCDENIVREVFARFKPRAVVHFAAETHVDRSISGPDCFFKTNVMGTVTLLRCAGDYYASLTGSERSGFRFLHVSTDEVYGSLATGDSPFTESSAYRPSSPYAASKAASDHAARAWFQTYGFPVITTHCSNNYGPRQFPEKLIPLMITRALRGLSLPVYGDGQNVRDWLFVGDHNAALRLILERGRVGERYNVGAANEHSNLTIVHMLCHILDELRPKDCGSYADQIEFVDDRLGHDRRYSIDATKLRTELGWRPEKDFEEGMRETVLWYLEHDHRFEGIHG